jgi:hypothetical protein
MKPKLNQIIAVEKGTKTKVYEKLTENHKLLQRKELFLGHARRYSPKDDDPTSPTGEQLPPEEKRVQAKAEDVLRATAVSLTELFDVSATRDWGNTKAKADVVVEGKVIVADCPVTFLLFLEKQLADIHTLIKKLPTLDSSENWHHDDAQDLWATEEARSVRTKKISRALVLYEATKEHPAQVKEVTEDVLAGTWTTIKYSSSLPVSRVNELLGRVDALQKAVKFAREQANTMEVDQPRVGKTIFDFLLA